MKNWGFRTEQKATGSYEDMRARQEESSKQDAMVYNEALKSQDTKLCESISDT